MKFSENIKHFLYIPATQRRGYVVLFTLFIVIVFLPTIYKQFFYKSTVIDISGFAKEIQSFEHALQKSKPTQIDKKEVFQFENVELSAAKMSLQPFPFDPNNLPVEEWRRMGMTERQIRGIKNYEMSGGHFRVKGDVNKLFVISDEMYEVLKPYILLPDEISKQTNKPVSEQEKKQQTKVDLNTADTTILKNLPGIGSYFARTIVRYRTQLGGYIDIYQLLEIKHFDTLRFLQIEKLIDLNPFHVKKININTADLDEFRSHPYINYNIAMSLVNYRKIHGNYLRIEDIMNSALINQTLFDKLAPYLTIENDKIE